MADALNRRVHDQTLDAEAPTVTAARGHRIAVGDLIISRRNDPTIDVPPHPPDSAGSPQRSWVWRPPPRLTPPWREGFGPDWTRFPIARLYYTKTTGLWTLYWRDRNLKQVRG